MKIVADERIPWLNESFGRQGSLSLYNAEDITSDTVQDADILLVRSVTRVDPRGRQHCLSPHA